LINDDWIVLSARRVATTARPLSSLASAKASSRVVMLGQYDIGEDPVDGQTLPKGAGGFNGVRLVDVGGRHLRSATP
jgi:hypothetical protein